MTVSAFSHVNINVASLEASLAFYADTLGMPIAKRFPRRNNTGRDIQLPEPHHNLVAVLSAGRGTPGIEMIEWHAPGTPDALPPEEPPAGRAGLRRLRIATSEACAAKLARDVNRSSSGTLELCDPDGTTVEVVEGPRTSLVGATSVTADLDRTLAFYESTLGLRPAEQRIVTDAAAIRWRRRAISLAAAEVPMTVEFVECLDGAPTVTPTRRGDTICPLRLAFIDGAVEQTFERALAAGAPILTPPTEFLFGNLRALAAMWFDPDGVLLEVLKFTKA